MFYLRTLPGTLGTGKGNFQVTENQEEQRKDLAEVSGRKTPFRPAWSAE